MCESGRKEREKEGEDETREATRDELANWTYGEFSARRLCARHTTHNAHLPSSPLVVACICHCSSLIERPNADASISSDPIDTGPPVPDHHPTLCLRHSRLKRCHFELGRTRHGLRLARPVTPRFPLTVTVRRTSALQLV